MILIGAVCSAQVQQPTGVQRNEPPPPALSLIVLQGQGATHNITSGEVTELVVEVRDEFGKPVAGADVKFELPSNGPSGVFPDGGATLTVKSNPQGQAAAFGFKPNRLEGAFVISVTARQGDRSGRIAVRQANSLHARAASDRKQHDRSGVWKALLAVGSIAATGSAIALSRRGGSSPAAAAAPSSTGFTVTPGPITVSPPR